MPKGSEAQSSNSVAEYSKDSWTSRRKKMHVSKEMCSQWKCGLNKEI